MSLVVALRTFPRDSYVGLVLVTLNPVWGGGLCLLSFGLFFPGGVVLQVLPFLYSYQCPTLEGQAPKQLTNQQQCKPYDLNIPGGGQYTQNHP